MTSSHIDQRVLKIPKTSPCCFIFALRTWNRVIWQWMKTVSSRWEKADSDWNLKTFSIHDWAWLWNGSCSFLHAIFSSPSPSRSSLPLLTRTKTNCPSDPGLWFGAAHRRWNDGLRGHPMVPGPRDHAQLDALQHDGYRLNYRMAFYILPRMQLYIIEIVLKQATDIYKCVKGATIHKVHSIMW